MQTTIRSLALAALVLLGGCYHYVPAPTLSQPQGTPVRARLSTLQSFELAAITVNNVESVEGEMIRVDGGDLVLSATWLSAVTGIGYIGNGWTVRIPETAITGVEIKRFSWWRTGVVIGGVLVGTSLGFGALGFGPGGGDGGGLPGPIL